MMDNKEIKKLMAEIINGDRAYDEVYEHVASDIHSDPEMETDEIIEKMLKILEEIK